MFVVTVSFRSFFLHFHGVGMVDGAARYKYSWPYRLISTYAICTYKYTSTRQAQLIRDTLRHAIAEFERPSGSGIFELEVVIG